MADTDVPGLYQQLVRSNDAMLQHQALHTTLLSAIHKRLEEKKVPFRLQVPNIANQSGTTSVPFTSAHRGEILTVQNPTANPLTVDLRETNGAQVLKVTVAGGDYKALFVPFFERVHAFAGTGMIISGNVIE